MGKRADRNSRLKPIFANFIKKPCMQLKGLVRFFTILLILYSIYELSFTWVVRSHERKMEAAAKRHVAQYYPTADAATKQRLEKEALKRLLDSTKDETVHYGVT